MHLHASQGGGQDGQAGRSGTSGGNGYARPSIDPKIGTIVGKALEDFDGPDGVIEVVVCKL